MSSCQNKIGLNIIHAFVFLPYVVVASLALRNQQSLLGVSVSEDSGIRKLARSASPLLMYGALLGILYHLFLANKRFQNGC